MTSLYGQYIAERQDMSILENEFSFVTYKKIDDALFIEDMYVVKEKRDTKVGLELLNNMIQLAKILECNRIITLVDITTNNWEKTFNNLMKNDFKTTRGEGSTIYLVKEL